MTEDALKAAAKQALADTSTRRPRTATSRRPPPTGSRLASPPPRPTAARCWPAGASGSPRRPAGALGVIRDGLEAAAKALDLPSADVKAALKSGKSLKDLATTQKVDYATVSAAIVAAVKADLDKAVADGTIKQAREHASWTG